MSDFEKAMKDECARQGWITGLACAEESAFESGARWAHAWTLKEVNDWSLYDEAILYGKIMSRDAALKIATEALEKIGSCDNPMENDPGFHITGKIAKTALALIREALGEAKPGQTVCQHGDPDPLRCRLCRCEP